MIVWKFAVYLGVLTLLFALIVSVVAIARYGRSNSTQGAGHGVGSGVGNGVSPHDEMRDPLSH
jgi:hypothetical protein